MLYLQTSRQTGDGVASVRAGFSDYDTFRPGHKLGMTGGFLDAPDTAPSGGSTALPFAGTIAHNRMMANDRASHACSFGLCTCKGNGKSVHVRNV